MGSKAGVIKIAAKEEIAMKHVIKPSAGKIAGKLWCEHCRKWVEDDESDCPGPVDGVDISTELRVYLYKGEARFSAASPCYTREVVAKSVRWKIARINEIAEYLEEWLAKFNV